MTQATEDERRQAEIVEAGNVVARMVNEITALEDELALPVLSRPRDAIVEELRVLRQKAQIAETAVDTMLEEQNPPTEAGDDQFARGDDFIPVVDAPNPPSGPGLKATTPTLRTAPIPSSPRRLERPPSPILPMSLPRSHLIRSSSLAPWSSILLMSSERPPLKTLSPGVTGLRTPASQLSAGPGPHTPPYMISLDSDSWWLELPKLAPSSATPSSPPSGLPSPGAGAAPWNSR